MPPINLKNKPICITGASSGIGRAAALACARAGMPVLVAARRLEKLEELVEHIRQEGGAAEPFQVDVTNTQACDEMIARAIEAFGSIYAVYANAGYGLEKAIHEMSDAEMRDIFETNFFGALNTIRPALPHLMRAQQGHILLCSSCVARHPLVYYAAYSATKSAQHHIGRAMRLELEPFGVHVSTIYPVGTKTEFFDRAADQSQSSKLVSHQPDRLKQSPERVARATIKALRRPRPEVWTSWPVRLGISISAFVPRLSDAAVRPMVRKYTQNKSQNANPPGQ